MCKTEVSGEQNLERRSSIGNASLSPGTSPSTSSSSLYSREDNSSSPLSVTKKEEMPNVGDSKCAICDQDCAVKQDVLSCRYCSRYML